MSDIISAISTPVGVGGCAIIRVSGDGSLDLLKKIFKPIGKVPVENFEPYKLYCGEIDGGSFTDFGMAVFFKGPKSYTGEDMVELHCHGGIKITQGILKQTFKLGAMPASRGEYTKRAFINGKMSLDSCEGLISMINSESIAAVKVGYNVYREKLNSYILSMQDSLTYSLAQIDANIDYPEEDLEEVTFDGVKDVLIETSNKLGDLLKKYSKSQKIRNGIKVAIVGKPNTGKSSLLNSLLCEDKAIVSSIAGTTRDVVEGSTEIGGVKFDFYDTAGIREATDEIEKIGVVRSEKVLNGADIVMLVLDGSKELDIEDQRLLNLVENKNVLKVYNKNDLGTKDIYSDGLIVSAKNDEGIDLIKDKLFELSFKEGIDINSEYITEERHFIAMENAKKCIDEAIKNLGIIPLDLLSEDIKKSWDFLGEITGKTASEEIINEIFSKFCVGK